ncbi:MAG: hydroxyacylglutathione hydrolase [Ahrensia sp.]
MSITVKITRLHGPLQNYGIVLHDADSGETACVDAGEAAPILEVLEAEGWRLTQLWVTHHHNDHVAAIKEVKAATGCTVFGPSDSRVPIAGLDRHVAGGDAISLGKHRVEVWHTPGHTLDMLNYYLPDAGVYCAGDTLFPMGCGRLFEGTADTMFDSFAKLKTLPLQTEVYAAHEYTVSNAEFAAAHRAENGAIAARLKEVLAMRARGEPTIPTTIGRELETNPFMLAATAQEFAALRKAKDAA